ncbi:spore coat protein [Bacillus lacus]|uniref:Spore coat protein n=1 Tax=Metabacillus lacus TaxID=1983721 RepID=A0A7X2J2I3_9BACI|nr:spore coat protein [Metabacillus lacus]MRX74175.1 spore coat protein [Metabacillus lacus]
MTNSGTLALHETLELHELIAAQTNSLINFKSAYKNVDCPELKSLYQYSIKATENNLRELLQFLPYAPTIDQPRELKDKGYYAGELLGAAKHSIMQYAGALAETATPMLRTVFLRHFQGAVEWHAKIFEYMNKRSLYPVHNLNELLKNDARNANKAIRMSY